jgi:microcystin-dependent protein
VAADRSAHTSDVPAPAAVPRRGFLGRLLAAFAGGALLGRARPAEAAVPAGDSSAFISEIRIFATGVVPPNWALCQGQLLPIASNTALFSLIGTFYGGNGVSTFALPDLRGRVPLQPGQGPGLSSYSLGEMGGVESVTLSLAQLPSHTHAARGSTGYGATDDPANGVVAREQAAIPEYAASADVDMAPAAITSAGSGQPHPNMQPYLAINYIICLQGIFPSHS